jgi:hypothetical protein
VAALRASLAALAATAQDVSVGNETAEATAEPNESAPDDAEFKPPPGFKTRKRGELVFYGIDRVRSTCSTGADEYCVRY